MAGDAAVDVTASDGRGWATQTARILSCAPDCRDCPPTSFSDHPIRPGSTRVKAVHFVELRSRIDTLRMREGLQTFAWTDPTLTPGATAIRRIHVTELRTALEALYVAAGRARPAAEPVVTAGDTVIRAAHLMELRAAVLTLEASVDGNEGWSCSPPRGSLTQVDRPPATPGAAEARLADVDALVTTNPERPGSDALPSPRY
jgi:hypothetical protein